MFPVWQICLKMRKDLAKAYANGLTRRTKLFLTLKTCSQEVLVPINQIRTLIQTFLSVVLPKIQRAMVL
jgi:hypothetical protein